MPVYGARIWSVRVAAPGNSHCGPTRVVTTLSFTSCPAQSPCTQTTANGTWRLSMRWHSTAAVGARGLPGVSTRPVPYPLRPRDTRAGPHAWTFHHERPVADRRCLCAVSGREDGTHDAAPEELNDPFPRGERTRVSRANGRCSFSGASARRRLRGFPPNTASV